jgi:hypothetical protein
MVCTTEFDQIGTQNKKLISYEQCTEMACQKHYCLQLITKRHQTKKEQKYNH